MSLAETPEGLAANSPAVSAERALHINRLTTTGLFLGALAHELNNPLQVISGLVELLEVRADLPSDVLTKLQKIGTQATRASDTIRMVQTFVRDRSTEIGRVDVGEVAARALALRKYPLARANVVVAYEPPAPGTVVVSAVEGLLVFVVVNLVINVEQALTGRGGSKLTVDVRADTGRARLRLVDTGPGVEATIRDRIFEPFFTTKPPEQALGLGLPVARQVVESFGGTLTLEPTADGASFVIELPLA